MVMGTQHLAKRMSQRGITNALLETVLKFGKLKNERCTLDKAKANQVIDELKKQIKALTKIADKGGLTVVVDNGCFVTAWNKN